MRRTPLELAAIASAAVPGLAPTGVAGAPDDAADFDSAVLVDDAGKQWRVRSPRHAEASMRLETELLVLQGFTPAIRAELPFRVPSVAGTARQGNLRTFVYNHLPGSSLDMESLIAQGGATAVEIGRVIAAIHDLPSEIVDHADLPSYTANEFRQRKLNELDQAATTGRIPPALLRRWEHALEDVSLWKFTTSVVHGDLHEDNILVRDGGVTAITGWTDLHIGDPADDFAWLIAAHEQSFADTVVEAYVAARRDAVDPHLMRRAALSAEFALAQWLVRGLAADNPTMIEEAEEMLAELDADVAAEEAEFRAAAEEAEREAAEREAVERDAAEAAGRAAAERSAAEETAARAAAARAANAARAADADRSARSAPSAPPAASADGPETATAPARGSDGTAAPSAVPAAPPAPPSAGPSGAASAGGAPQHGTGPHPEAPRPPAVTRIPMPTREPVVGSHSDDEEDTLTAAIPVVSADPAPGGGTGQEPGSAGTGPDSDGGNAGATAKERRS